MLQIFEIVEKIFTNEEKLISRHTTIDEAINHFNKIISQYKEKLSINDIEEFEETKKYKLMEIIHHKHGTVILAIKEMKGV